MFVDIHTHNFSESKYPAIRNLNFSEADELFSSTEKGLFSVGFHPWFDNEYSTESLAKLKKWGNDNRMAAIGECGLDKNSKVLLEKQVLIFEKQILLSESVKKPLIIHCVGCFNELFELKKRIKPLQLWIIHGFRGRPELTNQALRVGCYLSYGEHFNIEGVRITPIDKLLIETDESLFSIEEIYRQIAEIKNIKPDLLGGGEHIYQNILSKFV